MFPLKYNKEEKVKIKGVRSWKGKLSLIGGSEKHGEGASGCIFKCGKGNLVQEIRYHKFAITYGELSYI